MGICDYCPPIVCVHGPPRLYFKSLKLLNFEDPDPVLAPLLHQAPAQQRGIMVGGSLCGCRAKFARVADLDHLNAIPNPAFHCNANPDPAFHFNADPDADPDPLRPLLYAVIFQHLDLHWEPPRLYLEPLKLMNFDFNGDPDPALKILRIRICNPVGYTTLKLGLVHILLIRVRSLKEETGENKRLTKSCPIRPR
jgi:hypothetical protein